MKKVLIIGVTIVAVIALGNVLLASAQGNPPFGQNTTCPLGYTCPYSGTTPYGGPGGMMGGRGMMGGYGTYTGTVPGGMGAMHDAMMATGGMHEQVWTAVATKLDMTYAELNTALQNGQTVAQLAQAKGVSLDELKQAAEDAIHASFADLVKQGALTQEQADWMADHMDDMPMFDFEQGYGPGTMGPGMMRGRGMMRGNGTLPGNRTVPGNGMMQNWPQPTGRQG